MPISNNGEPASPSVNTPVPHLQKLLYDRRSAAYVLSISVRSLDYLIAQKRLATIKLGKKIMVGHGALTEFCRASHAVLTGNEAPAQ